MGRWVTISGRHVYIRNTGEPVYGAAAVQAAKEEKDSGGGDLRTGELTDLKPLSQGGHDSQVGVNQSYTGTMGGEKVLYKPVSGTHEVVQLHYPDSHKRSEAAYVLDQELGFGLVPETVVRGGPHGEGAVQRWIEGASRWDQEVDVLTPEEKSQVTVFDLLTANYDRTPQNLLMSEKGIHLIDNDMTFPSQPKYVAAMKSPWVNPAGYRPKRGEVLPEAIPESVLGKVKGLVANEAAVRPKLSGLLKGEEIDALFQRAKTLVEKSSEASFETLATNFKDAVYDAEMWDFAKAEAKRKRR